MSTSKRKSLKKIPKFESEDAEREFWAKADSTAYVDWRKARAARFVEQAETAERVMREDHDVLRKLAE